MAGKKTKNKGFVRIFYKNITSMMLISFLVVTCVPIIILCTWSYHYLAKNIKADLYDRSEQVITGIDSNLKIYFDEIKKLTDSAFASEDIEKLLLTVPKNQLESIMLDELFKSYFSNLVGHRGDVLRVDLYGGNGESYKWDKGQLDSLIPENERVLEKLEENGAKFTIYGPRVKITSAGFHKNILTVGRQIKSLDTGKGIGYLVMDLDYRGFEKIIGMKDDQKENLLIIGQHGTIYYDNLNYEDVGMLWHEEEISPEDKKGKEYIEIESRFMDGKYLMITDREALFKKLNHVAFGFLAGGTSCFILFFLVAYWVSQSVSKPLKRLEDSMSKAESNGFNEIVSAFNTYGEVNRLTRRYNVMLVEIQRLLENEKELYRKKAESEYQALQLQITPHFLYNSLDSINCLAQVYGKTDISEMIVSLADIFKYNMRYDTKTVTLGDEIAHVKNYCMLQAVQFQERFHIIYEIEDRFLPCEVTKFMLQPLVENAIAYGVGKMKSGGEIRISASETSSELLIEVADNGKGMTREIREHLQGMFDMPVEELIRNKEGIEHIGLYNVNLRIKLQYGDTSGIRVVSEPDQGTKVSIHLPKKGAGKNV